MDNSPKYDPWGLVTDSLTGNLSAEGELQFKQWLSSDPDNREKYSRLQELYGNGMEDYKFYLMANETEAWKALQTKMTSREGTKVIQAQFNKEPRFIRRFIAISAVFLVLVGVGVLFIVLQNNRTLYETAYNEQKKLTLPDGTAIVLKPQTKIKVSRDYNKTNRMVIMSSGEASFVITHRMDKPFIVDLGTALVEDIGTSFTIWKEEKQIKVSVISGKVMFVKVATKETRELTAGMKVTFSNDTESFGEIEQVNSTPNLNKSMLNFNNTSLVDVIDSIHKVYGIRVQLADTGIAQKKMTAHLDGMPYDTVIKVICKSFNLEYSVKDSVYILKGKYKKHP